MRSAYKPLIILGAARSGTNMLRDLLTKIDGLDTWDCDEIGAIWRHGNYSFPHDGFTPEMARNPIRRFIRKEFDKVYKRTGAKYIVEKTCANSMRPAFVNEVLPDARFLVIYRDGRDCVASSMLRWKAPFDLRYTLKKLRYVPTSDLPNITWEFGRTRLSQLFRREKQLNVWGVRIPGMREYLESSSLIELCAEQWKQSVVRTFEQTKPFDDSRLHVLTYEDFVKNPVKEFSTILDWLGMDQPRHVNDVLQGVSTASIGKYKAQLSSNDIALIDPIVVPVFDRITQQASQK